MMRLVFTVIILFGWPSLLKAAMIEGRVMYEDEPLAKVVVAAYSSLDYSTEPVAISTVSDDEGYYRMELPKGTYAFYGRDEGQKLLAFSGRNPVNLVNETAWVGLQTVRIDQPEAVPYEDEYSAAIEGVILNGGKPLSNAYVYLYLDVAEDLKGQGYRLSMPTGPDGYFRFDGLPESDYFLVVRKRGNGERVGPVMAGDLFGIYSRNPLTAKAGEVQQVKVSTVEKLKDATESETFGRATGPVISGTVVDDQGLGVAGVHVFAYVDRVIGHQRPAAISTPTSDDGRFVVNLPEPGTYYIGARQAYGDSPAPGELFGMYEESADHGLTVKKGQTLDNLRIMVEPVEIF
ncbi:MAG: hypothetical protein GWO23_05060 [Gammaproteobacteria bacterium]|nr:hypothetical protein [Gammaproteobacteria bacterium]